MSRPRVLMGLFFFPRGGSSQVARYLSRFLPDAGWDVTLVTGSLGDRDADSNAAAFFAGADVRAVDYTPARDAPDPLKAAVPYQPSFEDRPGAPDVVFAAVGDDDYERIVAVWERELRAAGAAEADVLHLNHLTPMNEAAARAFPDRPVVSHLHGTEVLMLGRIAEGAPEHWTHAEQWADRMRRWAQACERLLVLSPDAAERAPGLLGVDPERVVPAPNGFDPEIFDRRPATGAEREAVWRRWLVEDPRGWDESGEPGSVSYEPAQVERLAGPGPVLIYVGRYTEVKRIPLLIRAHAAAREEVSVPAPLVLFGGYPGEWEGEHPLKLVRETGDEDVFLAGWRGHDDLAQALNAADILVLPSVHEQFGQVLVEAMACGLPVIAVNAHGPATIVDHGETGLLVPPDDEDALKEAITTLTNDEDLRKRMGNTGYERSRERYAWPTLAKRVAEVYESARS